MKRKVLIEIDEKLFESVKEHSKHNYIGSDVWIAVANGQYYDEIEDSCLYWLKKR